MPVEIKPNADIMLPNITLPAHENGGWALPGGEIVTDPVEAHNIARRLEKALGRSEPYNEKTHLSRRKS